MFESKKRRFPWSIFLSLAMLVFAIGGGVWIYKGPEITVSNIQTAMQEGDIPKLRENIDFPSLRSNIKVRMAREVSRATRVDGTSFGIGMELISGALLDKVIGQVVTPEWLVGAGMFSGSQEREELNEKLRGNKKTHFKSLNKANLTLSHESGDLILIFEREGLRWILVDIDGRLNTSNIEK